MTWCQPFGVQGLPKSVKPRFMSTKIAHFEVFFLHKIDFPGQAVNFCLFILYIFWKLLFQPLIWHIWIPSTCILWSVRFFVTFWDWTGSISLNLVLYILLILSWCYATKLLGQSLDVVWIPQMGTAVITCNLLKIMTFNNKLVHSLGALVYRVTRALYSDINSSRFLCTCAQFLSLAQVLEVLLFSTVECWGQWEGSLLQIRKSAFD